MDEAGRATVDEGETRLRIREDGESATQGKAHNTQQSDSDGRCKKRTARRPPNRGKQPSRGSSETDKTGNSINTAQWYVDSTQ